jgi:aromatic-L-amino-acid decarboxylase
VDAPRYRDVPDFDIRAEGSAALDWVAGYLDRVREFPVLPRLAPGELTAKLPATAPERGEPFAEVLRDLDGILLAGITHWQHPRFFSYFPSTASPPAILAELVAAALNQVGFIWRASPASTELELLTCRWLADLLGLPAEWHGHLEDTASTSTLAALAAARVAGGGTAVVFSEHAHSSVEKAARVLGLEPRPVPTDDEFRMRPALAADELARGDVAAVVATVGTTSVASVDPVGELAELCARSGAWLHVDAAYAGASWVCPEFRESQAGVALADSVVVNAHKWLLTPMDCSVLFTRNPAAFRSAFSLVPEYLRTTDDAPNLSDYGPALGRRFRSLKLWAVLRCYGRAGLQEPIREAVRLAELFAGWVRADPEWQLVARNFALVCFHRLASDEANLAILDRVNRSGEMFITHTRLGGRVVLRLAIGNLHTGEADVAAAWELLRAAG